MIGVPLSLVFGVTGLLRDRNKAPAILGSLISGGLLLFWVMAVSGVLWC
jgi:hypothetical protein